MGHVYVRRGEEDEVKLSYKNTFNRDERGAHTVKSNLWFALSLLPMSNSSAFCNIEIFNSNYLIVVGRAYVC